MIHMYGPPGDFPATLCGLNRDSVWGGPYAAVYGKDLGKVNCPDCLGRVEIPTGEPYVEELPPPLLERDTLPLLIVLVAVCAVLIVAAWGWLP